MNSHVLPHPDRRHGERRGAPDLHDHQHGQRKSMSASYSRFWAMVAASTAIGFAAMYLNTYEVDHVFFSWTRVFMAMVMGGVMTAVMMLFMWKMYPDKRRNQRVLGIAAMLLIAGVVLARTQATVGDVAYMKAMIPHHSIAILTSSRAKIVDPRVRKLADGISATQKKEISEMKELIADLQEHPKP